MTASLPTAFAPAARTPPEEIRALARLVAGDPLTLALFETVDGLVAVVDANRQIVGANMLFANAVGAASPEECIGLRPGEAFGCVEANAGPGGCGTSSACASCGAVLALLAALDGKKTVRGECQIVARGGAGLEARDFHIRATPFEVGQARLAVAILRDASAEKRMETLESVFFHDLLNTLNGLWGWASLLERLEGEKARDAGARVARLARRLVREVRAERLLRKAERGELAPSAAAVRPSEILAALLADAESLPSARERQIEIEPTGSDDPFRTDPELLGAVLLAMVANALEAIPRGERVVVRASLRDGTPLFSVRNPGTIPPETLIRIFRRHFTTRREPGRGLGTWKMKLFGEELLGGQVTIESSEAEGTCASIHLPASPPPRACRPSSEIPLPETTP
jgi:signal transduction histidine kinase